MAPTLTKFLLAAALYAITMFSGTGIILAIQGPHPRHELVALFRPPEVIQSPAVIQGDPIVERRLEHLESKTADLGAMGASNTQRLDRLDGQKLAESVVELKTIVDYDHDLIRLMAVAVLLMFVERGLNVINRIGTGFNRLKLRMPEGDA